MGVTNRRYVWLYLQNSCAGGALELALWRKSRRRRKRDRRCHFPNLMHCSIFLVVESDLLLKEYNLKYHYTTIHSEHYETTRGEKSQASTKRTTTIFAFTVKCAQIYCIPVFARGHYAFNGIQPAVLKDKLENTGVEQPLTNWMLDYLTNRPQCVTSVGCGGPPGIGTDPIPLHKCISLEVLHCTFLCTYTFVHSCILIKSCQ